MTGKPEHEFRIYPASRRGCYYGVQVFRSLKAMRDWCRKECRMYDGGRHNMYGITHSFTRIDCRNGRERVSKHIGDIHFTVRAGIEIVSHEATHAAFYFALRGNDPMEEWKSIDEPMAYAQGVMVAQMNRTLHDLGVWK